MDPHVTTVAALNSPTKKPAADPEDDEAKKKARAERFGVVAPESEVSLEESAESLVRYLVFVLALLHL